VVGDFDNRVVRDHSNLGLLDFQYLTDLGGRLATSKDLRLRLEDADDLFGDPSSRSHEPSPQDETSYGLLRPRHKCEVPADDSIAPNPSRQA
jgi:hypothetical protein